MSELPIPLSNYLHLIRERKTPYYDVLRYVIADMEKYYVALEYPVDVIYTINPRQLQQRMEEKIPSNKLTTLNITRVILATVHGSKLRKDEDYYITKSSGGRRNYHIKLNPTVLAALRRNL